MGRRAVLDDCGKSRPALPPEIRSPDPPVRSESLYPVRYPGPPNVMYNNNNNNNNNSA